MSLSTTDFSKLTDDLQELTDETIAGKVATMDTANLLFDVKDLVRKTYDLTVLHGVAGIEQVAEGANFPRASGEEGKVKIALFKSFLISWNALTV